MKQVADGQRNVGAPSPDLHATETFYDVLWAPHDWPEGAVVMVSAARSRKPHWSTEGAIRLDKESARDRFIDRVAGLTTEDGVTGVYASLSPLARKPARGRGTTELTTALPVLWLDVDTADGVHKGSKSGLPHPTRGQARDLISRAPWGDPTLLIDSGGGYHAYWALAEPAMCGGDGSDPDVAATRELLERWDAWWVAQAQEMGVHIDKGVTKSPESVMRIPGTINRKDGRRDVATIAAHHPEVRVHLTEVGNLLPEAAARRESTSPLRGITTGPRREKPSTTSDGDRPGDRLARTEGALELLLEDLGLQNAHGARWTYPREDGTYSDADTHAEVHHDDDGAYRVAIHGARMRNDWGLDSNVASAWDILGRLYCGGDWALAARVAAAHDGDPDSLVETISGKRADDLRAEFPLSEVTDAPAGVEQSPRQPLPPYLQWVDGGSEDAGPGGLFLAGGMKILVGETPHLLLVEGVDQYTTALPYLGKGILALGTHGWSGPQGEPLPLDALTRVMSNGVDTVTVAFASNVDGDRDAWQVADDLRVHMEANGVDDIRFIRLPGAGRTTLHSYLRSTPKDRRSQVLARLIEKARPLRKQAPARQAQPGAGAPRGEVLWDEALIGRKPNLDEHDRGEVLVSAAIRIIRTTTVVEDLRPDAPQGVIHDVEVAIGTGPDRVEHVVRGVRNKDLQDVNAILEQVPGGVGTSVYVAPRAGEEIAAIIRRDSVERETLESYRRTGLIALDDRVGYLHAGGCLTADGNIASPSGNLGSQYNHTLVYPDPTALDAEEVREAFRVSLMEMPDCMVDATAYTLALGAAAYAPTGAPPIGALALLGQGGSGKTTIANAVESHLSPAFAAQSMAGLEGTANSIQARGETIHHHALILDDARPSGGRKGEELAEALKVIFRRAYNGPSGIRTRLTKGAVEGEYEVAAVKENWPFYITTIENLPDGQSTLERVLSVWVTRENSLKPGGAVRLEELGKSGLPQRAMSAYIAWNLRQMDSAAPGDPAMGIALYREEVTAERAEVQNDIAARVVEQGAECTPRQAEVPAGPLTGYLRYVRAALDLGAITELEAKQLVSRARKATVKAVIRHLSVEMGGENTPEGRIIQAVHGSIAMGRATLNPRDVPPGVTLAGWQGTVTTEAGKRDVIFLIPQAVAELTRQEINEINVALRPVVIQDGNGKTTRAARPPVRVIGTDRVDAADLSETRPKPLRVYAIPVESFFGKEDEGETVEEREAA